MRRRVALALAVLAAAGCQLPFHERAGPSRGAPVASSRELRAAVEVDGLRTHLVALERIANRNGGTRAAGTAGYDASVAYVRRRLERAGYRVRVERFSFAKRYVERREEGRVLTPPRRDLRPDALELSPSTPSGGVRARLAVADGLGCEADDFGGARGKVALVERGRCRFSVKARNAAGAGALALVVYNDRPGRFEGTLGEPGAGVPAVAIAGDLGDALARRAARGQVVVSLDVQTDLDVGRSANVLAETPAGRADRVVVAGAHLDSVSAGPGINDNGSGVATLLEVARALARAEPRSRVRFAFWGAEELGLVGSRVHVARLAASERRRIALYLNFDMVGSPNFARFVYDGGDRPGRAGVTPARIERVFADYFAARDLPAETIGLSASDNASFAAVGIPTGGVFTGAGRAKTAEQVERYGGKAGEPYDRCYHERCDTVENVDERVLEQMADAAAHAIWTFAVR